ncbi:MAG: isocitrate/isopropylmalate family dehydrogenase [bacterium]|nr:isocitrate/isopropylmalate family dehydrogenase [bacterium]
MTKRTIVTMPGDGIGIHVLEQALRVLDVVGFDANYVHADIGWELWKKEGNALPQRTLDLLAEHHIGLFGAITSKPKDKATAELDPSLKDKGFVYFSPIVGLRQHFNLQLCIRPCRTFAGNPLNFIRRTADGGFEEPFVDVVIFRQNTECLYSGVEWTNPPDVVRKALETHKKMAAFKNVLSEQLAISCRIFTWPACIYIAEKAFEYADKYGYKSVTVCEKPNVIRETSGMMEAAAKEANKKYPHIERWSTNIDAQMMWLTKNPEDYGVILSGNMFGDIVSDGFAGLTGGLGFALSGNIGEDVAVFEPTHGSAPKYAGFNPSIVNPIAMILSAAMMLDHIGEIEKGNLIRDAVADVIKEGKVRTYDMLKMSGKPDVISKGAASCEQMATAVIDKIKVKV